MSSFAALIASPAGVVALAAATLWPSATGFATWVALSRGRLACTLWGSISVGLLAFNFVQRLTAPTIS